MSDYRIIAGRPVRPRHRRQRLYQPAWPLQLMVAFGIVLALALLALLVAIGAAPR